MWSHANRDGCQFACRLYAGRMGRGERMGTRVILKVHNFLHLHNSASDHPYSTSGYLPFFRVHEVSGITCMSLFSCEDNRSVGLGICALNHGQVTCDLNYVKMAIYHNCRILRRLEFTQK